MREIGRMHATGMVTIAMAGRRRARRRLPVMLDIDRERISPPLLYFLLDESYGGRCSTKALVSADLVLVFRR